MSSGTGSAAGSRVKDAFEMIIVIAFWASVIYLAWTYIRLEPGYKRNPDSWWPLSHVWSPGMRHPEFPHISADAKENYWRADYGYKFPQEGDLHVEWSPNRGHPVSDHIRSDFVEGRWVADPGYRFSNGENRSDEPETVQWMPGTLHPSCSKLMAAERPEHWRPVEGYRFVSEDSFDVTAQPPVEVKQSNAGDIFADVAIALIANSVSRPTDDDGFFTTVSKSLAREIRDQAATEAVKGVIQNFAAPSTPASNAVIACDYWEGIPGR